MFIALSATFYLLWKTPQIPTQNNKWVLYWVRKVQRNLLQFASQGSRSRSDSVLWWNKYYGRHTSLSGRSLAAAHSSSLYILILLAILSLEIPQSSWQEICNPSLQKAWDRGSPPDSTLSFGDWDQAPTGSPTMKLRGCQGGQESSKKPGQDLGGCTCSFHSTFLQCNKISWLRKAQIRSLYQLSTADTSSGAFGPS